MLALVGIGVVVGLVVGCIATRWVMRTTECPRCNEQAFFDCITYRCVCSPKDAIEIEEL